MNLQRHYGTAKFSHCSGVIKKSVRSGGTPTGHKTNKTQDHLNMDKKRIQALVKDGKELYQILQEIGRSMEDIPNYKGERSDEQ